MIGERDRPVSETKAHVFPPALVPLLREQVTARNGCLKEVRDGVLIELLTTIFWAGLETHEGEHNTIGVAFLGTSPVDFIIPDAESGTAPLYQWKVQRFESPRPFAVDELVKLAVAGGDRRIHSAVNVKHDGTLVIAGLAREGFNVDPDPFIKIMTPRPGCLFIRSGRELLLAYDRGAVLTGGEDVVFSAGPVRRALEANARAADLDEPVIPDYVEAVRSLVREMAAHGRGGILIVSPDEVPDVAEGATYRMAGDSSLASLLRLARRVGRGQDSHRRPSTEGGVAFASLLRNAFLTEAERVTEELGALTAIDGAIVANRHLALVAFGVMLPLGRPTALAEAADVEGRRSRLIDLGSRGTRHHAGATYAGEHPGSVVFVASEDGQVSCMFRDASQQHTLLWRVGPAEVHSA
jgi:DisA bacterial checkpoint controller nucleotide-binding